MNQESSTVGRHNKNSRQMEVLLAIFERLVQRGTTALLTLLIAFIGGPAELGRYASAIVVLTLYQAVMEVPFRQVGVTMWRFRGGQRHLRGMAIFLGALGVPLVAGLIVALSLPNPAGALDTLPVALVPIFSALSLGHLTAAQRMGKTGWSKIGRAQALATTTSLILVVPFIFRHSVLAASLQVVIAECIFAIAIRTFVGNLQSAEKGTARDDHLVRKFVGPTVLINAFGWSQTQLERLVVVFLAPVAAVGAYSLSIAMSRTVSDAVTVGSVNAVRAHISLASDPEKPAQMIEGANRTQKITLLLQFFSSAVCVLVLPFLLSERWHEALLLAPLFGASSATLSLSWVISAYLIEVGRSKALLPAQLLGILFSITVGFTLFGSLLAGAIASIFRDVVNTALRMILVREILASRDMIRSLSWGFLSIGISILLYFVGTITIGGWG